MQLEEVKPEYYYQAVRRDVLPLVDPRVKRILDVGCGEGWTAKALRDAGAVEAAGIEFVESAAAKARAILDRVICGDVATVDLDFPAGHFDVILCLDVLEHLAYPDVALGRLAPLLADDGEFIISVPNVRYIGTLKQLVIHGDWPEETSGVFDRTHLRWFTPKSTRRMLARCGLKVVRTERHAARPFTAVVERFPGLSRYLSDWFTCQFVYTVKKV
jgi:2-polyprenyl-3-methyl-5-hydroxy-6-metoxy-1,4-benzoquinol methylase